MITLCTVVPKHYEIYVNTMLASVYKHLKLVSKIYIAQPTNDSYETIMSKEIVNNIEILKFTAPTPDTGTYGHSMGLHACINKLETEYAMFSDPDLFYMSNVDKIYLDLKSKFQLNYIGCSHHSATSNAYGFFPYLMSSIIKTDDLPPKNWKQGYLKYRRGCLRLEELEKDEDYELADGKYLLPGPIPEFAHKFPNVKPTILFDAGNSLCLYGIEQQWKWLSFQTSDCHSYSTKYYRTSNNLKIKEKLNHYNLLWHSVRSGPEVLAEKYREFENDINSNSDSE